MQPPITENQVLDISIDRLGYGGDGVAHPEGFALFVPRTAPGDRIQAKVTTVRRRYGRALPQKILTPSSHRDTPVCPYYDSCGGCHYQHLKAAYIEEQKVEHIREAIERLGPGKIEFEWRPMEKAKSDWGYRNRLTYHRSDTGAQGYRSWNEPAKIVDIDECAIADPDLNAIWKKIREILKETPAKELPYVVLRKSSKGQFAIILTLTRGKKSRALLQTLMHFPASFSEVHSIQTTEVETDSRTPFGKKFSILKGESAIEESVHGLTYSVRPDLFFQIHSEIAQHLVKDTVEWAENSEIQNVLDLYCGAGLFSIALAKAGKSVVGVDVEYPAILSAKISADKNAVPGRAQFRAGKADRIVERLWKEGSRFDSMVADPPRKGLQPKILDLFPTLGIKRVLYVSCSPPTFARDVKELMAMGYKLEWLKPYDMFPKTYHVELLASFVRS